MNMRIRRAVCLLLAVLLLPAAAAAGNIEELAALLTRPAGQAAAVELRAEAIRVPELDKTRTEWLNGLLKHVTIRLNLDGDLQKATVEVDGETAFSCMSRSGADGTEYLFSFDNGEACRTEDGSSLPEALSGLQADVSGLDDYSNIAVLTDGFYRFFSALPETFPEQSSMSKVNIRYKTYGTAVKRWSITLPQDVMQSEQMAALLAREEMAPVRDYLSGAVLSGRQRLTLLTDADDRLMKVNYTGNAGLAEDDIRRVNLDWRCLRSGSDRRDVLKLTTPAVTGSRRDNLSLTLELKTDPDGRETLEGQIETDRLKDRVRTLIRLEIGLQAEGDRITGNLQEKRITGSSADITAAQADLTRGAENEYYGSLEITHILDKIEKEHFRFQISAGPGEALQWNASKVIILTEIGRAKAAEKAARAFLNALRHVPEEDLQYILADLPDGTWEQIIDNTEEPEETEQP